MNNSYYITPEEIDTAVEGLFRDEIDAELIALESAIKGNKELERYKKEFDQNLSNAKDSAKKGDEKGFKKFIVNAKKSFMKFNEEVKKGVSNITPEQIMMMNQQIQHQNQINFQQQMLFQQQAAQTHHQMYIVLGG